MALDAVKEKYIPRENNFYRDHYRYFFYVMMILIVILLMAVIFVLYQIANRPLPEFAAKQPNGSTMGLISFNEPNLLPDTIIRFASKAAVTAYSFDFVNYDQQLAQARPFFTVAGWSDFNASINKVIGTVVQNQLFVSGVVSGAPVISNQGVLPDTGYTWRVQIPFLVTYQSANKQSLGRYYVILTIVRVPTSINPQGIGIDQFVMSAR